VSALRKPPAKPFHPLLVAGLIAPLLFFAAAYIIEAGGKTTSLGGLLWFMAILLELIMVPIGIFVLARGGYGTRTNIIILLLAASPILLVVAGVLIFLLGGVHL
jgi:hypothetical protein